MAIKKINVGAAPNDQTGDALRSAFQTVNANTADLDLRAAANAAAAAEAKQAALVADGKAIAAGLAAQGADAKATAAGHAAQAADDKAVAGQQAAAASNAAAVAARQAADVADGKAGDAQVAAQAAASQAAHAQQSADAAQQTADAAVPLAEKGRAGGVAPLDESGLIAAQFRPKLTCAVVNDATDLDHYKLPADLYFPSVTEVKNLPAGLGAPCFLSIDAVDDAVVQSLTSREPDPRRYHRTRLATGDWSPWREVQTSQDISGSGVDFNALTSTGHFYWRISQTLAQSTHFPKLAAARQCGDLSVINLGGVTIQRLRYGTLWDTGNPPEFTRQLLPASEGGGVWTAWKYAKPIADVGDLAVEDCGDVWLEGSGWRRWSPVLRAYQRFSPAIEQVWQERSTQDYATGPVIRSLVDENCHFTVAGNNGKGAIFRATPYADANAPTMIMACGTAVATVGTTKNGWGGPLPVRFVTDDVERGRITGSRWVLGPDLQAAPPYSHVVTIHYLGAGYEYGMIFKPRNGGTTLAVGFMNSANALAGSIQVTDSITQYNTASDYRLKHDIAATPIADSYRRIMGVRVVDYSMADAGVRYRGTIAHELQEVIAQAVTGVKDGMIKMPGMDEAVPDYQQVDYSKLVPDLVAALQHADQRIRSLEERLAAMPSREQE